MDTQGNFFFKQFSVQLVPVLCKVFNYALSENNPPESWSEAIVSVIHKQGKDTTQCSSYRPISLLCNDFKILTSILNKRIQKYIKKRINPDKTGFVPGHHGKNNIRRTLNLQSISITRNSPSILFGLDAEKAFDSVDWLYLELTLKHLGINDTFTQWLRVLYKNPKSRVRVNGFCSQFFKIGRGTRQGDIWVLNTLNVWDTVRRKYGVPNSISRASPIANNPDFKPSLMDISFKRWEVSGLMSVNQLLEEDHFKSVAQLQQTFSLPSKDLFRFFKSDIM